MYKPPSRKANKSTRLPKAASLFSLLNKQKEEENSLDQDTELRQVDRKPPKFMQENAQRGLDNLNKAGDGLVDETVRQARIRK